MKRSAPMKRTRMRKVSKRSAKSGGHLFPKGALPKYRKWIRAQTCLLDGRGIRIYTQPGLGTTHACWGFPQVAHVKSRGAGGADAANVVPLCALAHHEQHGIGIRSFEARWGVDLKAEAAKLYARYQAEVGAAAPGRPA